MANAYLNMDAPQLEDEISRLEEQVAEFRAAALSLDMARGKPSLEQVDLSRPMLDQLTSVSDLFDEGVDAANYGGPDGIPSARRIGAELLGTTPDLVTVSGSSSLSLMYDVVCHAWVHGVLGERPWCEQGEVAFLCPSPGYDRHFAITEHFGIKNIPIEMGQDGPDMDEVCRLVESDASIKGIWCVPKYANPTGVTYSDEVVRRFAALKPAAPDFRILWDNAYAIHDLEQPGDELLGIFDALAEAGATNRVYAFASTSKVTFPGSGMAFVAASADDMADLRATFAIQRVCPDKLTQLLHVRYLADLTAMRGHMARHAQVLRPRFDLVERKLSEGLRDYGCARWTHPKGGYFVSFDGPEGSAKAIVSLMAELGVTMTGAGATWPYGDDPRDTNIRIAPTYPTLEELGAALDVFVVCVRLVAARLALASKA